jgi:hypothetical protein
VDEERTKIPVHEDKRTWMFYVYVLQYQLPAIKRKTPFEIRNFWERHAHTCPLAMHSFPSTAVLIILYCNRYKASNIPSETDQQPLACCGTPISSNNELNNTSDMAICAARPIRCVSGNLPIGYNRRRSRMSRSASLQRAPRV